MRKACGWVLISSPFVAFTALMVSDLGWKMAAAVWGSVLGVSGVAFVGSYLIWGPRK